MTGRIAVYSRGLLRLGGEIRTLTGLEPGFRLGSPAGCAAIAGWGHKPTADRARRHARRSGLPYLAFEDGFLRSLKPGQDQRPLSMVLDRTGIYYDARQPSDLETLLQGAVFSPDELQRADDIVAAIAAHGLSKYNHGTDDDPLPAALADKELVLVVDQTAGDESIAGGLATPADFERMVDRAIAENPAATVIAKLHPETLTGAKRGHLLELARRRGLTLLTAHVSPWPLLRRRPRVYTVSSQFGFEALLAGCRVTCFGMPFYAGWGLTDDRQSLARRSARRTASELAAAVYLRYSRYFDAWRRTPVDPLTAIDQLAFLRRSFLANATPVICLDIARWKRRAIRAMLDGPAGPPVFVGSLRRAKAMARENNAAIAAWGAKAVALRPVLEAEGIPCVAIEDGFVRSAGLGAAFVQPRSLVFDRRGLYFDPSRPSDIEHLLAMRDITAGECQRAERLRQQILAARISKYNMPPSQSGLRPPPPGRPVVLAVGQVADDAAIALGRIPGFPAGSNINAQLLARVRQRHPGAYVIFKPHPDVEHMGRRGEFGRDDERVLADDIARNIPLDALFSVCDQVEVYSSLTGFEALLRGLRVTAHGLPFYAGWGLTEDLAANPRRGRPRSLDEVVAMALVDYPRYWDPESGLACPPEVAVARIAETRSAAPSVRQRAGIVLGKAVIMARHLRGALRRAGP